MKTLSTKLTAEQKKDSFDFLNKIVLTKAGEDTQTYTVNDRILSIDHIEDGGRQTAMVLLDNADGALTDLDLRGYQGVVSNGMITSDGDEYSAKAPQKVIAQQLLSWEGKHGNLRCMLSLAGKSNLMTEDRASGNYTPADNDNDTVKTLIRKIAGDSGVAMLSVFNHCVAHDVVFDSEDSLIDSYKPRDSFGVYLNSSRWVKIKELLGYTSCVARFEDDGDLHIFNPTTTGTTYDYEYSLASGEHTFFAKSHRKRVVIPNYIVVSSLESQETPYTGFAKDDSADLPELEQRQFKQLRVESNAQCTAIATALLSHYQMDAEKGHGEVPINVGAEVYDYVKITDAREDDSRVGNISYIRTHFKTGEIPTVEFRFGVLLAAGLAGTATPSSTSADLSELIDLIAELTAAIEQLRLMIQQIIEWLNLLWQYVYIDDAGDLVLRAKVNSWIIILNDMSFTCSKKIGFLLSVANCRLFWHDDSGTYEHIFCPETTDHGGLGDATYKWLSGYIREIHCDDELYIPSEA